MKGIGRVGSGEKSCVKRVGEEKSVRVNGRKGLKVKMKRENKSLSSSAPFSYMLESKCDTWRAARIYDDTRGQGLIGMTLE